MQWSPCNTCVPTDRSLGFISHLVVCLGSRREYISNGLYEEAPPEREHLFQASGIWKGGILLVKVYKRVGNLSFGSVKGSKGLTNEFYGFIKSRRRSIFETDSYLMDSARSQTVHLQSREKVKFLLLISTELIVHLQQSKGMQSSKQGTWKRFPFFFFNKRYTKGVPFS